MQQTIERNAIPIGWMSLGCSLGLWITSVNRIEISGLSFAPPFSHLGLTFWIGLIMGLCIFFLGNYSLKLASLVVLAFYYITTISFIYKYPVMHDSILNVQNLITPEKTSGPYGQSYWGFSILITWIEKIGGQDPWIVARFFPAGMAILYFLILVMIGILWRKTILTSNLSGLFFVLFIFVFGETFYLRINASPQTVGFFLFLIMLGLIPLSTRSIWFKVFVFITMFAVILTHPITPLLALPGLLTVGLFSGPVDLKRLWLIIQTTGVFLVGYITWTLYQANWVLVNAVKYIVDAFQTEKITPIVGYSYTPQADLENFLFWHRILIIALLVLLAVAYITLFKSKTWQFVTVWGLFMLPPFLLLFTAKNFFDRILLFSLVPCAIVFGEAAANIFFRFTKFRIPVSTLIIFLAVLSAYTSYFGIGAVDRITQDEVEASQFIKSAGRPLKIYAGGFALPLPPQYKYIPSTRGEIDLEQVQTADVFVLSQQMENSIFLDPRAPVRLPELLDFLQQNYYEVYTSGNVRVFLKRP